MKVFTIMKKFLAGVFLFFIGTLQWQGRAGRQVYKETAPLVIKKDTTREYSLYITIDDGPLEGAPFIDTVFRKEKVPADLFLVGAHVYQDEIFSKYLAELRKNKWFEFDNHSFTHANEDYEFYYAHPKMVLHDMRRNNDSLHFLNQICRMPARNMWRIAGQKYNDGFSGKRAASLLKRNGYSLIGWDMEWEADSLNQPLQSPDSLFHQLQQAFLEENSFVAGHVVLLCHDWMFTNSVLKDELESFIHLVKGAGNIRFEWLRNYPLVRKG